MKINSYKLGRETAAEGETEAKARGEAETEGAAAGAGADTGAGADRDCDSSLMVEKVDRVDPEGGVANAEAREEYTGRTTRGAGRGVEMEPDKRDGEEELVGELTVGEAVAELRGSESRVVFEDERKAVDEEAGSVSGSAVEGEDKDVMEGLGKEESGDSNWLPD